jgi:hypothetical protein
MSGPGLTMTRAVTETITSIWSSKFVSSPNRTDTLVEKDRPVRKDRPYSMAAISW